MPALSHRALAQAFLLAFAESGASALELSPRPGNPKRFVVQADRSSFEAWIYVWTLTHGGGAARPTNEYRIQITGVTSPLLLNPRGGPTLLMGYEPNTGCFAGFDVAKHFTFSRRSPSIQIPITALHDALQFGLAFAQKGNDEIAVAIRPDQLLGYVVNAPLLHAQGSDAVTSGLLARVAELGEVSREEMETLTPERQRIVSSISRLSRESSFRRKVITAYERRCAVTRIQLDLIDAAHILSVGIEGSSDDVRNGLCLSPTYHRAFDRALIFLDESLVMRINEDRVAELQQKGVAGGLHDFQRYLNQRIHLPPDREQWPDVELIRVANRTRGIG
jgi:putative restriction endonuclease